MSETNDNIFNYFDNSTQKILINSQKIARGLNACTGTEHLLLALLITPNTVSQKILTGQMIGLDHVKLVLKIEGFKEQDTPKHVTREFQNILKMAIDHCIYRQTKFVDPGDLLWAILNSKNCSAHKILSKLGINRDEISYELDSTLQDKNIANFSARNNPDFMFGPFEGSSPIKDDFSEPQIFFDMPGLDMDPNRQKSKNSYLEEFGVNLTKLAKEKKLDPIVGRVEETDRLMQILCRRNKNNPVLIGEPGVGKTAIVEGLAQKIIEGKVPLKLIDKQIITLDLAMTVAGTMYRGQFETRIKKIISEAKRNPNIILFIDEIHTVIGTGSAEGSMDTANILKPALSKGEIKLIGATTTEEYRKHIEKDAALERRLQKIIVNEPTKTETSKILNCLKKPLEDFHHVTITEKAIDAAIKLSSRYISDRFLPDKAIDLLDEASASTNLNTDVPGRQKLALLHKNLSKIISQKDDAIEQQDFAQAAYLRSQELQMKQELAVWQKKEQEFNQSLVIDEPQIAKIVSSWTQIPFDNLIKDNFSDIKNLENKLAKFIIGQKEAIKEICATIKKTKMQLTDPHRPLGTFIFLGPTGVGKTKLAKVLSKVLFGTDKKLIKLDMSEFMERHNVSRLVGAPPGYVGYDDAGKFTELVRNNPYSVILLDEIEKAHPEVFNILLQMMEDGYLTDAKGRRVNFKNTILIMTSNIGVNELNREASIGFRNRSDKEHYQNIVAKIHQELKNVFKIEFLNRLDNIIIFKPLGFSSIEKITIMNVAALADKLQKQQIKLNISPYAIKLIAKKSYNPEFGAREVRRMIDKYLTKPISELLISEKNIRKINVLTNNGKIIIHLN